jgi:hypothetical protein
MLLLKINTSEIPRIAVLGFSGFLNFVCQGPAPKGMFLIHIDLSLTLNAALTNGQCGMGYYWVINLILVTIVHHPIHTLSLRGMVVMFHVGHCPSCKMR